MASHRLAVAGGGGAAAVVLAVAGWALIMAGTAVVVDASARFARAGGTPAPVAETDRLVVDGPYRYTRNPMYLAVGAVIAGQVALARSAALAVYLLAFAAAVVAFVHLYEQPRLRRLYGEQCEAYRAQVPGWYPRLRPWPGSDG